MYILYLAMLLSTLQNIVDEPVATLVISTFIVYQILSFSLHLLFVYEYTEYNAHTLLQQIS